MKHILNKSYGAYDALEDMKALSDLVLHTFKEPAEFLQFSFPPKSIFFSMVLNKMKAINLYKVYDPLETLKTQHMVKLQTMF